MSPSFPTPTTCIPKKRKVKTAFDQFALPPPLSPYTAHQSRWDECFISLSCVAGSMIISYYEFLFPMCFCNLDVCVDWAWLLMF